MNFESLTPTHPTDSINEPFSAPSADGQSDQMDFFCNVSLELDDHDGLDAIFIGNENQLWRNGQKIIYAFCDGNPNQHNKVQETIKQWEDCVNLQFVLEADLQNETHIRISFLTSDNYSYVGRQDLIRSSVPTMRLGSVKATSLETDDIERHVILHEWGHLLGLSHEHQSPRFQGVTGFQWDIEECHKIYKERHPTKSKKDFEEWLEINIFAAPHLQTNYGRFDPSSIMLYTIPSQCYKVPARFRFHLQQNYCLSGSDKAFMAIHYPKTEGVMSFNNALRFLSIPDRVSKGWKQDDVRRKFWSYVGQVRFPRLNIYVKPSASEKGQTRSYEIQTHTNLWEFKPRTKSVARKYEDFVELKSQLEDMVTRSGFPIHPSHQGEQSTLVKADYFTSLQVPHGPQEKPTKESELEVLKTFMSEIHSAIAKGLQTDEFREKVRWFLQDGGRELVDPQDLPPSSLTSLFPLVPLQPFVMD